MKKIYGLAALAAAMTLASCSNNDEPNVVPAEVTTGTAYFNVSLNHVGEGTKALGEDFEYGEKAENDVTTGVFLFFDKDNNDKLVGYSELVDLEDGWKHNTTAGNIAATNKYKTVEVTTIIEADGTTTATAATTAQTPDKANTVIAVLNPTNTAALQGCKNLSEVMALVNEHSTTGGFVMSNAAYNNGTANVYAQPCTVYGTAVEAEAGAVTEITVERQAAKVIATFGNITYSTTDADNTNKILNSDGEEVNLMVVGDTEGTEYRICVTGVDLANYTKYSYTVKNLPSSTSSPFSWQNTTYNRSHWATSFNDTEDATTPQEFQNINWNSASVATWKEGDNNKYGFKGYLCENTSNSTPQTEAGVGTTATKVILTAKLQKKGATDTSWSDATVYYVKGETGVFYTESSIKARIARKLATAGYTMTYNDKEGVAHEAEISDDMISIVQNLGADDQPVHNYDGSVNVAANSEWTDVKYFKDGEDSNLDAVKAEVAKTFAEVWKYDGGAMYYYVDIETSTGVAGIVRNHVYKLDLNSITGLGTAMFNNNDKIIPEKPDEDPLTPGSKSWTMTARINVLQWAVVEQQINF